MIREMRCAGSSSISVFPPIELAYLAGILRKQAQVKILDANALNYDFKAVEQEIRKEKPETVVFTASPVSYAFDAQIAKIAKNISQRIKTILLDSHIAPVMSEKVKQNFPAIDYLVSQEPLLEIPKLLRLKGVKSMEEHPRPAYDLLPIKKYWSLTYTKARPFATLITSAGCPNQCNFCIVGGATVERGYGRKWRFKSPLKILDEIKYLKELGIKDIYFFDETFTVSKQRIENLCQLMLEKGINISWSCNGRVDTLDKETIKLMKQTGCWNIMFGIECSSQGLLEEVNKGTTLAKAMEVVRYCKELGLNVSASFVIGLPNETRKTVKKTLALAKRINPYRAQFVILTPYPGTRLYDEVRKKGLLEQDYNFAGYDAYCLDHLPVIRTKKLSAADLLRAQKYIYRKFYLRPSFVISLLASIKSFDQLIGLFKSVKYLK